MTKIKISFVCLFLFSCVIICLPGCVYLTHLEEVTLMQNLAANQREMQVELDKEKELFNKLKTDIDNGRLKKLTRKHSIIYKYGEPISCKPAEGQSEIKQTCVYRKPSGELLTEMIRLNFDFKDKLYSWEIQNP